MTKSAEITLAGQVYTVRRLPVRPALAWRKQAEAMLSALPQLGELFGAETDNVVASGLKVFSVADGLIEQLIDLVFSGSPELMAQRDAILETLDDGELFEAFQTLLVLNLPLASVVANQTPVASGEATPQT
jgi:hypothetical protein